VIGKSTEIHQNLRIKLINHGEEKMKFGKIITMVTVIMTVTLLVATEGYSTSLGPVPEIDMQGQGLTIALEGVGLENLGAGTEIISINIGGPVMSAFLYWAGRDFPCQQDGGGNCVLTGKDEDLIFDGNAITGQVIGTEVNFATGGNKTNNIGYRADVTSIVQAAFASAGMYNFTIEDGDLADNLNWLNGASLLVIYTDESDEDVYRLIVFDGLDFAFAPALPDPDAKIAEPVSFTYDAAGNNRTAKIWVLVGDAEESRPDRIDISDNPSIPNQFDADEGISWDNDMFDILIPAGIGTTTLVVVSPPEETNPDSLLWELAAIRIPIPQPCIDIEKNVSVDGGLTFVDADTCGDAPTADQDAEYQLVVENCGDVTLTNVTITDPILNVTVNIGTLDPGQIETFTKESSGFENLAKPGVCPEGLFNIALVTADQDVFDDDPACVNCEQPEGCRVTAGGNKDGITFPCLLKSNGMPDRKTCAVFGPDTWGGQAGAQPGIDGNWTHHHKPGPHESFVFHSNDLSEIICSDPGDFCEPARFAPNRQIDFKGLGRFVTEKGFPNFPTDDVCFYVHLEDTGEPGPGGTKNDIDPALCTHCPGTPIINAVDCENCTDYYMIRIYDNTTCTGDPIYVNGPGVPANCGPADPKLGGYFTDKGNVQLHPENN
jgi:uncharacterized repeat protein (TIGR01451 family)